MTFEYKRFGFALDSHSDWFSCTVLLSLQSSRSQAMKKRRNEIIEKDSHTHIHTVLMREYDDEAKQRERAASNE